MIPRACLSLLLKGAFLLASNVIGSWQHRNNDRHAAFEILGGTRQRRRTPRRETRVVGNI